MMSLLRSLNNIGAVLAINIALLTELKKERLF